MLSKLLHRFPPNFAQWQRLANTLRGWSSHPHNESKMADGRHIEKRYIVISPQRFNRSPRNLAWWRKLALSTQPAITKKLNIAIRRQQQHGRALWICICNVIYHFPLATCGSHVFHVFPEILTRIKRTVRKRLCSWTVLQAGYVS